MKKTSWMFVSIVGLQVLVVLLVVFNHKIYANSALTKPRWSVLTAAVFAIALVSMVLVYRLLSEERENMKLTLLKNNLQQIEDMLKVLRTEKHEFNHHLQTLQALLYLEQNEEALQYINDLSAGRGTLEPEIAAMVSQPVVAALLNSKYNLAQSQNIKFALAVTCDLDCLKIEAASLVSILNNLIDNALEASLADKHPRVGIEFKCQNGKYLISVHNNGRKITPPMVNRLYEAGFTTKRSSGRGYGLMIAKRLAEENGGQLEYLPGETTTFLLTLPARNAILNRL